jgi:integrase
MLEIGNEFALAPSPIPEPPRLDGAPACPSVVTLTTMVTAYLQEYEVRQFRINIARCRVAHLRAHFGDVRASDITMYDIRQYQVARREQGGAPATINRETSALNRMFRIVVEWGWLPTAPLFPGRLRESAPRQGFFEHSEYLAVRRHLPPPYQDVLDFAYYSGWRKREILDLSWDEVDLAGGVVRLAPGRSKTGLGRVLPLSRPLLAVLRRRATRRQGGVAVFDRDGITVRIWRLAFRRACEQAGVPGRLLHDCRRTAARNLIRAGVPERVAMTLTGHKTRCIFDRYNIVNERELFSAGEQLVRYLSRAATRPRSRGGRASVAQ